MMAVPMVVLVAAAGHGHSGGSGGRGGILLRTARIVDPVVGVDAAVMTACLGAKIRPPRYYIAAAL